MRSILVLTSTYPRWKGDTEPAFIHSLCKQLTGRYKVILLAPHYPGAKRREELDGIKVYRFFYSLSAMEHLAYDGGIIQNMKNNRLKYLLVPFFIASQYIMIVALCRKHRISLIHAHWLIPQGLSAVLSRYLIPEHIRILCTSHGGDLYSLLGGSLSAVKRYVLSRSDHVTVVSEAMKSRVLQMGCHPQKVTMQSMGVDLKNRFTPDGMATISTDLIFVGRLVEKKGVSTLVEAVHHLRPEFPELKLTIIGDGPERYALEKQARTLGIYHQIDFLGAVPNERLPDYYRSARIAIVPSIVAKDGDQEGLGLVAVEAMGCGCATVVSNLPALEDVVEDRETGLMFESGNAADLADKIRQLLVDESLRLRLARKGREYVASKFDWEEVGNNYIEIIDKCLTDQAAA